MFANTNSVKSRNSRLSFKIFEFATGDIHKVSRLEIDFMLDTGPSCSIINYRTFREIQELQHRNAIQKSIKVIKTYQGKQFL